MIDERFQRGDLPSAEANAETTAREAYFGYEWVRAQAQRWARRLEERDDPDAFKLVDDSEESEEAMDAEEAMDVEEAEEEAEEDVEDFLSTFQPTTATRTPLRDVSNRIEAVYQAVVGDIAHKRSREETLEELTAIVGNSSERAFVTMALSVDISDQHILHRLRDDWKRTGASCHANSDKGTVG